MKSIKKNGLITDHNRRSANGDKKLNSKPIKLLILFLFSVLCFWAAFYLIVDRIIHNVVCR